MPNSQVFLRLNKLSNESSILIPLLNNFGVFVKDATGDKAQVKLGSGPHWTSILKLRTPFDVLGWFMSKKRFIGTFYIQCIWNKIWVYKYSVINKINNKYISHVYELLEV